MEEFKIIPLVDLSPSKLNPRKNFDQKSLQELAESIREKGVLQPIMARPLNGGYEIVSGERRYRAACKAGLSELPVIVRDLDDKSTLEIQVIENLQREDVHPLEEAEGYEQLLKKHGYVSTDDIAVKVGKSKSYVYGRMKLCDLTQKNRKRFYEDKFTPSIALLVARIPKELQDDAGLYISGDGQPKDNSRGRPNQPLSYKDAKEFIEEDLMMQLKDAPFDTKDPNLFKAAGSCIQCPKRTGNQNLLFPDIKNKDVCTDTVCYKSKVEANGVKVLNKAKQDGRTIINKTDSKKIFNNDDRPSYDSGFVDISKHTEYKDGKSFQLTDIIKKAKKSIEEIAQVAIAPSGKVVQLIPRKSIPALMKEAGYTKNDGKSDADRKRERLERQRGKIRKKAFSLIVDNLFLAISNDQSRSFQLNALKNLIHQADSDTWIHYSKIKSPEIGVDWNTFESYRGRILSNVKSIDDALVVLAEISILRQFPTYPDWDGVNIGDMAEDLCQHYLIDTKVIFKKVRSEFIKPDKKAKEKPKKAKKIRAKKNSTPQDDESE